MRPEGVQSLTLPYPEKAGIAPDISVTDYGHKIVYARLGQQLRIAAMVDIGYDGDELRESRIQALKNIVARSFPELEGLDEAEVWTGMRPSTPAGPPMLGRAGYPNLWMNLGGVASALLSPPAAGGAGRVNRQSDARHFFRRSHMETNRMTIIRNNPQPRLAASVAYGDLLFLSGQTPKSNEDDIVLQTREVLRRSTRCWPRPGAISSTFSPRRSG